MKWGTTTRRAAMGAVLAGLLVLCAGGATPRETAGDREAPARAYADYKKVVADTAAMVSDAEAQKLAEKFGLQILNVTWEDTGRYKGSAVGPNISDMTIQVQQMDPRTEKFSLTCMPVIRFPNFADKSADIKPDRFFLRVGNERGGDLKKITLAGFLEDIRKHLTKPDSWKGKEVSLLAKRDTHVLVSAQACFLPVPKAGIAEFNPVLFNYQSYEGDPAVLTILATREGTSVTVIDNKRDAFQAGATWGQRLFFNQKGERAGLTGKRMSDFLTEPRPADANADGDGKTPEAAGQAGLNMVLLIQVPLKQKKPVTRMYELPGAPGGAEYKTAAAARKSDVEEAVIGHGKVEGPFTEIAGLEIQRDDKFPIRVTVQFYKATSNGQVSEKDLREISEQIERVYKEADYVGSLVVDGPTRRPTEYEGDKFEPPGWWDAFWKRHQENTGMTPQETMNRLRKLYGPNWTPRDQEQLLDEIRKLKEAKKKAE